MNDNRVSAVAQAIRSAIIEQAIKPGARLPEDTIGERFGVSRTIVRSALTRLAGEGLVEQRRNRGAIVAEPSWNEARDTFDLRLALEEIVVARLAGTTLQADQIAALEAHVDAEDQASNKDEAHSIRLAGEFHNMLAELTGSKVLSQYMRELTSRCCLMLALYSRPHSSECGVSEHRNLVELLKSGDQDQLVITMRDHLRGVIDRALIQPPKREDRDIGDILASYTSD